MLCAHYSTTKQGYLALQPQKQYILLEPRLQRTEKDRGRRGQVLGHVTALVYNENIRVYVTLVSNISLLQWYRIFRAHLHICHSIFCVCMHMQSHIWSAYVCVFVCASPLYR